jgi:hypothetical protein
MRTNTIENKNRIVEILSKAFDENKSVNYIVPQDSKRSSRIRALMDYSYDVCSAFGKVYLTEDDNGCALVVYPEKKKTTLTSVFSDFKFIFKSIGITNIKKAMQREAVVKKQHPDGLLCYLWFIGTDPSQQGKGIGTTLLHQIITDSEAEKRIICLETSTQKNIAWYKQFGFEIYNQLDFGYTLYCMKKIP